MLAYCLKREEILYSKKYTIMRLMCEKAENIQRMKPGMIIFFSQRHLFPITSKKKQKPKFAKFAVCTSGSELGAA